MFRFDKEVFVTGLPRCGSMFIFQLLNDLFAARAATHVDGCAGVWPGKLIGKTHCMVDEHKNAPDILLIGTIRHPLQALCSWFCYKQYPLTSTQILENAHGYHFMLQRIKEAQGWSNFHLVQYESWNKNHSVLYDKLEHIFDVSIPNALRLNLSKNHDIVQNQAHVTNSIPWQSFFPEEYHDQLLKIFEEDLIHFGYADKKEETKDSVID